MEVCDAIQGQNKVCVCVWWGVSREDVTGIIGNMVLVNSGAHTT